MPALQEVYNKYKDQVVLISVAIDNNNDPESYVKKSGFNWPFAYDTDGAAKYSVQVIDCQTGKSVGEFGSYGNMGCQGKGSKFPHPELPFGTISALSVWQDRLFVADVLNRRIVKCRIVYGQGT